MIVRSQAVRRAENFVTYAVALTFAGFCLLPLIWLALTSLKPESDIITSRGVVYIPSKLIIDNYIAIWQQTDFPTLFRNSLVTTLVTVALSVSAGTIAAYAFARQDFRGRREMLLGLLLLRMFPAVVKVIPLFIIMRGLGLLDTRFGLGIAYTSFLLPLFIWLMKGFFDAIPRDLEDAARIDGCTRLGALFRIVLPVARNGVLATMIFIGIAAWNEFIFALILTTSAGSRTWPVGLQLMVGEFQLPWGMLAAGGVLSIVPVIILFAIVQRSMLRGLTEGATKG
jgi:multiple sugar transport system permease protein